MTIEENFLRSPYGVTERNPGSASWNGSAARSTIFALRGRRASPLVHNMDRASWVLGNAVPVKCHGLAGRSTMLEPVYGDVLIIIPWFMTPGTGVRAYAVCRMNGAAMLRTRA